MYTRIQGLRSVRRSSYGCIVFSHGHSTFKARYRIDHALIAAVHQIACIVNGENNYYTCMKYLQYMYI